MYSDGSGHEPVWWNPLTWGIEEYLDELCTLSPGLKYYIDGILFYHHYEKNYIEYYDDNSGFKIKNSCMITNPISILSFLACLMSSEEYDARIARGNRILVGYLIEWAVHNFVYRILFPLRDNAFVNSFIVQTKSTDFENDSMWLVNAIERIWNKIVNKIKSFF